MTNQIVTTTVDLLRHGDVEGGRKYRGQLDEPLSKLGWQQLREATVNKHSWQQLITSPLKRCADFANELANAHGLPLRIDNQFKEVSFGRWEGKTADEILATDAINIKNYWHDPINTTPPQGENLLAFESRIVKAWATLLAEFQGQHVLLISHAGVIRILLCHVLGMPISEFFKLDVGLAKASRIEIQHADGENWPRLIFHGCDLPQCDSTQSDLTRCDQNSGDLDSHDMKGESSA